jgi:hypothetical protein
MRKMKIALLVAVLSGFLIACTGSHFRMTPTHMEKTAAGKPIRDALIIVVVDDQEIRKIFENYFKKRLMAKGVEAITSTDALPGQKGTKLKKNALVEVIDRYGNDSVLITHLVGFDEAEVFSRDAPQVYRGYYGFYNYAWGYVHWPTVYGEKVQITLETRLYDVKTESLIWSGESALTNPETPGKAIGQVVDAVMKALEKNGLLPNAS